MSFVFQHQKSVRTHTTNRVGKTGLKNCQILENVLEILIFPSPISRFPSPKIQFSSPKIRFSSHEIQFSPIGFLLSSTAFHFLQQLSDFLQQLSAFFNGFLTFFNGFLTFFNSFPTFREIQENLFTIFCHSLLELCNFCYNTCSPRSKSLSLNIE